MAITYGQPFGRRNPQKLPNKMFFFENLTWSTLYAIHLYFNSNDTKLMNILFAGSRSSGSSSKGDRSRDRPPKLPPRDANIYGHPMPKVIVLFIIVTQGYVNCRWIITTSQLWENNIVLWFINLRREGTLGCLLLVPKVLQLRFLFLDLTTLGTLLNSDLLIR